MTTEKGIETCWENTCVSGTTIRRTLWIGSEIADLGRYRNIAIFDHGVTRVSFSLRSLFMRLIGLPLESLSPSVLALLPTVLHRDIEAWLDKGGAITPCDVLIVLVGGSLGRASYATEIYHQLHPQRVILFTNATRRKLDGMNTRSSRDILTNGGIPPDLIYHDRMVETTFDEGRRLRELVSGQRLLVVTDWYHRRRARLVIDRVLRDTGSTVSVVGAPDNGRALWWRSGERSLDVVSECAALFYYAMRGRI